MRLIIAGGRDYRFETDDYRKLDDIDVNFGVKAVLTGGSKGADTYGRFWAKAKGIPLEVYPADWDKHGKAAGPIRNRQMAKIATALAVFPGGKGTDSMVREAHHAGLKVFDFRRPIRDTAESSEPSDRLGA